MSARIAGHLRSNVYGLIAVFLAMTGTAMATHPGGDDTIDSGDIVDNEVRTFDVRDDTLAGGGLGAIDLRTDSVRTDEIVDKTIVSADVRNDALAGGGLGAVDLAANSVGASEVDGSLDANDLADTNTLGGAEIDEGALDVVKGPANMQMLFGREQLSGAESGPSAVIFAPGRVNVNAEKNSLNQCSLTLFNSPFAGGTLTFVREVVSGSSVTVTDGTLAEGAANSTAFSGSPVRVRWQAWFPGDPSATGRVITVEASARSSGTGCDFSAVMTAGA